MHALEASVPIKVSMPFHFDFSAGQIIWTLTFAGLLVLLVVLLGRDRVRRYPWFTASIVLMALRMVSGRLLSNRMPPLVFDEIFLTLSDAASIVAIGVVIEIARRAFKGASRNLWIIWTLILLALSAVILVKWGPWPAWKTLTAASKISVLRLMQLFAQKADLLADTLIIPLGLLVVLFGRRFQAGFRSHTQQIAIGLAATSVAELSIRLTWQYITMHTTIHSQAEYNHIMDMQGRFYDANNAAYLAALIWWIACLWIDEPTSAAAATASEGPAASAETPLDEGSAASPEGEPPAAPPAENP